MPPEKFEEGKKVEISKGWQLLQLYSLQVLAGSIVSCSFLYWSKGEQIITKGFGSPAYAILFASFFCAGVIAGFGAGTKGLSLLIHVIRITKTVKDE